MNEKILIDTSVFVEAEIDPVPLLRWLAHQEDVVTSEVVLAEFSVGIHAPAQAITREQAKRFFDEFILPLPARPVQADDFREVGRLIGNAIRQGKARPGLGDGLIALCALREGRTVATTNIKDFKALGVHAVNPLA